MSKLSQNLPNAGKLMLSLRAVGYDNYAAISDITDNSLDADARNITLDVIRDNADSVSIVIADDGTGMNMEILDEALKLGSETEKDEEAELGKYGMGLCTASLSICRKVEVITKTEKGDLLYSSQDIDDVVEKGEFVKVIGEADDDARALFESYVKGSHGTVVVWSKVDRWQDPNLERFTSTLSRKLGQAFRYYLRNGRTVTVNGAPVAIVDPLMLDEEETEVYSEETYPVSIPELGLKETVRVKMAIIPEIPEEVQKKMKVKVNQANQGFYVLRNNREIAEGVTMRVFTKHNQTNRLRMELHFTGGLDNAMGVNFSKQAVHPHQAIIDKLYQELDPQIRSIRKRLQDSMAKKQVDAGIVDHSEAETNIANKAPLLIRPKPPVSEPTGRKNGKRGPGEPGVEEAQKSRPVKFEDISLGAAGPLFDCYMQGRMVVLQWNIDHPFYDRTVLQRQDKSVLNMVDYLAYGFACGVLLEGDDEKRTVLDACMSIMSSNVRTLMA